MGIPIIEIIDVDTIYEGEKIPAIRDISLKVDEGDFMTIIGPNAVGKTTLLETINGLLLHTRGQVLVSGQEIQQAGHQLRKEIGYIPQDISFDPLTPHLVRNVVLMGRYGKIGLFRRPSSNDLDISEWALAQVGIEELASRPIGKLSGGQQQKVLIARMLAKDPRILLLDEPFSNLDFKATGEISDIICRLHDKLRLTTLIVLHDLNSIPERCNRVTLMNQGHIVRVGSPSDMLTEEVISSAY